MILTYFFWSYDATGMQHLARQSQDQRSGHCLRKKLGEIDMYVKMRITCTWTKKPYETLLFAGIGIGLFLRSLGEGQRRLPSGRPKPVVRYNSGRARVLVVNQVLNFSIIHYWSFFII